MKEEKLTNITESKEEPEDNVRKSVESPLITENNSVKLEMVDELLAMGLSKKVIERMLNVKIRD